MTTLVLTVVGDDRSGLVAAVAGIIEIWIAPERADELRGALAALDGLLTVTAHTGTDEPQRETARPLTLQIIGNDRPGIIREISTVLRDNGVSIDRLTSRTTDAAMYGGRLFEATVSARVPASVAPASLAGELERLATEIQVDVTLGP